MNAYPDVREKRILITGSSSGLGLAMAKALLQAGASVMITGRSQGNIDRALAGLGALPGKALGACLDVRSESSIRSALDKMLQSWGGIDVLINNAGIGMRTVNSEFLAQPKPFWEVPADKFRDLIETNLTGYFLAAKAVVPYFLKQGAGRVINISINHETMKRKGFVPYGPSRAATESLSHIMAQDLLPFGIAVNLLLPGGATLTGMIPEGFPESRRSQLLSPEVMAEPVLFLCSEQAKAVHDERIVAIDFADWRTKHLAGNAGAASGR